MSELSAIIEFITASVWAMEPDTLQKMWGIAYRHALGVRLSAQEVVEITGHEPMADSRERKQAERRDPEARERSEEIDGKRYELAGSVALVPVSGVIAKYASQVNGVSQPRGTSVQAIRAAVREARADAMVGSVVLRVESPGGTVDGVEELAAELAAMRGDGGAPVLAYAEGPMASAAYWIASSAREVYATTSARVGSIGVYTVLPDTSKMFEQAGVTMHLVKAGQFKGIGERGVPVSADQLAKVQERINDVMTLFTASVERGRKRSAETVAGWATGDIWMAGKAHEMGLIDGVKPLAALVDELNSKHRPRQYAAVATVTPNARSAAMKFDANGNPIPDSPTNPAAAAPAGDPTKPSKAEATPAAPAPTSIDVQKIAADAVNSALTAESNRVSAIQAAAAPYRHHADVATLERTAIADRATTVDKFRTDLLAKVIAVAAVVGAIGTIDVGASGWDRELQAREAIMVARMCPQLPQALRANDARAKSLAEKLEIEGGDPLAFVKTLATAEKEGLRRERLVDVANICATRAVAGSGVSRAKFRNDDEMFAAAFGHSTSDLPKLLAGGVNKTLMAFFTLVNTTFEQWAGVGSLPDFKDQSLVTLSELPELELLPPGQDPTEGKINERGETTRLKTYGKTLSIDRQTLINDDLNGIGRRLQTMGNTCALLPEMLAYKVLNDNAALADGVALFHATHKNLLTTAALSHDAVTVAKTAMMKQVGFGQSTSKIMVQPRVLLVPTSLWAKAQQITGSPYDPTASNANALVPNVNNDLKPVSSLYLEATSSTAWYLIADSGQYPVVVVYFLNGRREPFMNPISNGSMLGMRWEVIFDCAAKGLQFEGAQKNPGA